MTCCVEGCENETFVIVNWEPCCKSHVIDRLEAHLFTEDRPSHVIPVGKPAEWGPSAA
jgi:hypothetical protein